MTGRSFQKRFLQRTLANNNGTIMLIVILITAILAFYLISNTMIKNSMTDSKQQTNVNAQANNIARAGLIDAINWFRSQASQPVRQGALAYADAAFSPSSASDTIDSTIGLVKESQIGDMDMLYGRYEVHKQSNPATYPYDAHAVHDVSGLRIAGQSAGAGLAWYIESVGYLYQKLSPAAAFNQSPNRIIARSRVATEIRRIAVTLPGNCAVITNSQTSVTCQNNGRIIGGTGNIGLGYYSGATAPTITGSGSQITGGYANTYSLYSATYPVVSFANIFGLTPNELRLMSDVYVTASNPLPASYPSMAVVYVDQNQTFDDSNPLQGGGILYVNGNLTVATTSNALFSGVIFVTGTTTINGPALISGVVISGGAITLNGVSDVSEVIYDGTIINSVRQQAGQYRENKSVYYAFSALQ